MNAASAGQYSVYAICFIAFILFLYDRVCKEEPMEIPEFARGSLQLVRYSDDELREPNDSPFFDDYERPLPPAA